jgi:hypothetical protein
MGARFLAALPSYLRSPMTVPAAADILRTRLRSREDDFLALAKRAVYGVPANPYRRLLELAGCEYGDLEALVRADGLDEALLELYRRGVYLTVEEFKGRRDAVRGSAAVSVEPSLLRNPSTAVHIVSQTSGSRGASSLVPLDLRHVRERTVGLALAFDARGGSDWSYALWGSLGGASIVNVLQFAGIGHPPAGWFSQVDPKGGSVELRARVAIRALRTAGAVARVPLPRPKYIGSDDPRPLVAWLRSEVAAGRTPHLYTYTSPAIRLTMAAQEAGVDLEGVQMMITGEPITSTRDAILRESGAAIATNYGSNETGGVIGYGCLAPDEPDEVHLFHDVHAVIEPPGDESWFGLGITSLRAMTPLVLINLSLGDTAAITSRDCGCPLHALGWTTHLHTIRSFEKLNAEGCTLLGVDIIGLLEETLPGRFGGVPTDYQLVDDEDPSGRARLRLLVDPSLGPLDESMVRETFLTALGEGVTKSTEQVLRDAHTVTVERRTPIRTGPGKVLHLYVERRPTVDA